MSKEAKVTFLIIGIISLILIAAIIIDQTYTSPSTIVDQVEGGMSPGEMNKFNQAVDQYKIKDIIICVRNEKQSNSLESVFNNNNMLSISGPDGNNTYITQIIYPKSISYKGDNIITTDVISEINYNVSNKKCYVYDLNTGNLVTH